MALMYAGYPDPVPIEKGVRLVMSRQRPVSLFKTTPLLLVLNAPLQDGSWPQEAIEGVFNKTCAIAYPNFKFSFPIWMLGKAHHYLAGLKLASTSNGMANGSGNGYTR